jgi:plastocyanin domain-containing protein
MIAKSLVTLFGLVAIAWVNWYFLIAGRRRRDP